MGYGNSSLRQVVIYLADLKNAVTYSIESLFLSLGETKMVQSIALSLQLQKDFNRLITQQTGLVIREQDSNYFLDKVAVRMKALKLVLLEDYYQLLKGQTNSSYQEWEKLIILLTNNESYFLETKNS